MKVMEWTSHSADFSRTSNRTFMLEKSPEWLN